MIGKKLYLIFFLFSIPISILCSNPDATYYLEIVDDVNYIRNVSPMWGDEPEVSLELLRVLGDLDTSDENFQFFLPQDVAEDSEGNIYVLDSGNYRIQKLNPEGEYLATIGRRGKGPVEFEFSRLIEISRENLIYVFDSGNNRIEILDVDGNELGTIKWTQSVRSLRLLKTGELFVNLSQSIIRSTPARDDYVKPILFLFDAEGIQKREFGEPKIFSTPVAHIVGNTFNSTTDDNDTIFLAFSNDNRIEKYTTGGSLIFRSERRLNYEVTEAAFKELNRGWTVDWANSVSKSIGIDHRGRIWVVTFNRQMLEEEQVRVSIRYSDTGSTQVETFGDTDILITDIFKLEIFNPEGILLGEIPLTHFVDGMKIYGDRLYIVDRLRGMQVFEYRIVEK